MENQQPTKNNSEDGGSGKKKVGKDSNKETTTKKNKEKKSSKKATTSTNASVENAAAASTKKTSKKATKSKKATTTSTSEEPKVAESIAGAAILAAEVPVATTSSAPDEPTPSTKAPPPEAPSEPESDELPIDSTAFAAAVGRADPPSGTTTTPTMPPEDGIVADKGGTSVAELSHPSGDDPREQHDADNNDNLPMDSSEYERTDFYQDESSSGRDTTEAHGFRGGGGGGLSDEYDNYDDDDSSSAAAVLLGDASSLDDDWLGGPPDRTPPTPHTSERDERRSHLSSDDGDFGDDDDDLMDRSTTTEPSFVPPMEHTPVDVDAAHYYDSDSAAADPNDHDDDDQSAKWYSTDVEERGYEPAVAASSQTYPPQDPPPHEDEGSWREDQELKRGDHDSESMRSQDAVAQRDVDTFANEEPIIEEKRRWGCILLFLFAAVLAAFGAGIGIGIGVAPKVLPTSDNNGGNNASSTANSKPKSIIDSETVRPLNPSPSSAPIEAVRPTSDHPTSTPSLGITTTIPLPREASSSPFLSLHPSATPSCDSSADSRCISATLMSILEPALPSPRSRELLHVNGTCQNQALAWLQESYASLSLRARVDARIKQKFALAVLHCEWHGSEWTANDLWLSNVNECLWQSADGNATYGTVCDESSSLYRTLNLERNNLRGTIPAELAMLSTLQHVRLGGNLLTGTIPAKLRMLSSLQVLSLKSNYLRGSMARVFGLSVPDSLINLDVTCNDLTGTLPEGLSLKVPLLKSLLLFNNDINGALPSDLGSLTSLRRLRLDSNRLSGTIPPAFVTDKLQSLRLDHNRLRGTVPMDFATNSTQLRTLTLHANDLTGSVEDLCTLLPLRRRITADLAENSCSCCVSGSLVSAEQQCR